MPLRPVGNSAACQANSRSYIDWPNTKGGKQPGSGSSLIGAHRVASNVGGA